MREMGKKGCSEFASDCGPANEDSLKFLKALGFEEANRIICFRKDIYRLLTQTKQTAESIHGLLSNSTPKGNDQTLYCRYL